MAHAVSRGASPALPPLGAHFPPLFLPPPSMYHLFGPVTQEVTCFEQAAPHGGILVSAEFR